MQQHTSSREDAEDILVETFLAALENEQFTILTEKEQPAWLWRVARNKTIDLYRRSIRPKNVTLEQIAETVYEDDELTPEAVTLRQEEYAYLQNTMKSLSTLQQEVLRLRFSQGLRCAEIATRIGKGEGAVRVLLSRALNMLRNRYGSTTGNRKEE